MERGSDKHSGRVDEAMAHEVSGMVTGGRATRAEEWRSAEPAGEDQPEATLGGENTLLGGTPDGMTADDVQARSELASWLGRANFPAVREVLLQHVRDIDAPDAIVEQVRSLPAGREYLNAGDVWRTLHRGDGGGEHVEAHRF